MRFGPVPVDEAEGAILVHSVKTGGLRLKKGQALGTGDLAGLRRAGIAQVVVARPDADELVEDEAASRIADVLAGRGVRVEEAFTGRVNLFATVRGVLAIECALIEAINRIDEAITVATLPAFADVEAGQMVATVKIIPFAAPAEGVEQAVRVAGRAAALAVHAYRPGRAVLIQTELPGTSAKMLDKTKRITADRLASVEARLIGETRCGHDEEALARAIADAIAIKPDLLLIAGATAITDRRDIIPAAITRTGGRIEQFGMPVDPGNLLLLASIGATPVIGMPGCARSPKLNGFDWVLQRVAAGLAVGRKEIIEMGVGGLLCEIPTRPQPREKEAVDPLQVAKPAIAAVILAAGRSSRMGPRNKLLLEVEGRPMIVHAVTAAREAGIETIHVVTGHQREAVETALEHEPVRFVHNPDFARGLASSLRAGIAALGADTDAALVMLGDMPGIAGRHVAAITAAFDPSRGRSIIVPTVEGRRGNPVLWDRRHFPRLLELDGDQGARSLIAELEDEVAFVAMPDAAAHHDIDTPEAYRAIAGGPLGSAA